MPVCLLCPERLTKINEVPDDCSETLEITDRRDDYYSEDGDGVWVGAYLEFLEEPIHARCHQPDFRFSNYDCVNQDVLDEIDDPYTRRLIIALTNEHYEPWRDKDVTLPNCADVRCDSRDFCDDCDSGWSEIHGEYDGPLAEDVGDDEDEDETGISEEEQAARHQRNRERECERERRRQAQEDAESEVVDRQSDCEEDCDSFYEHISDIFRERVDSDLKALKQRWEAFLEDAGESAMPELRPQPHCLARPA